MVIFKRCGSLVYQMISPTFGALTRAARTSICHLQKLIQRHLTATVADGKYVVVQHEQKNNATMKFPSVWLRDNCYCEQCFHQSSKSRRIDWDNFDTDVLALDVQVDSVAEQVTIQWSDKHVSTYDLHWLSEREFRDERKQTYLDEFYRPKPKHWAGKQFREITETFNFDDVMQTDDALRQWLEALAVRGVAIIECAPLEKTVVRQLADRVGFIRRTTYGEEFIVEAKPGAKNYAYLSHPLPLHTDLPYYEYKPSVNILHCLVQSKSEGGSNLLVDGFYIADRLRAEHPTDFHILTETLVDWNDIGSEDGRSFHNIWRAPVICLDSDGNYTRINHSVPQRDSHFSVPLRSVIPWYQAYAKFVRLARRDAFAFKTKPGDVLTFNNIRLLHGRTGYDDTEQNIRYIVGAYLDWDIIYSKLRVLKSTQAQSANDSNAAAAAAARDLQASATARTKTGGL
ncbi:PREDICTED: gamma-butyrobetaine dioxygenase-like [Rhagoletis zephyria]|uniref:gamma-butyrobetaine dioxygenase-like n=1 Tax=Rhagoletis zephyria TaxID=28612 RepID=UPI00081166FA|nr:PREDICTED: gamma-butyrobetaine dioxygenase-like [Rhagoletis zephyria]